MKLAIPDMTCGHCRAAVEEAVAEAAPGARVRVDLAARTAEVEGAADAQRVMGALAAAGYPAHPA
jgi:copper chaperone